MKLARTAAALAAGIVVAATVAATQRCGMHRYCFAGNTGGILLELGYPQAADLGRIRGVLSDAERPSVECVIDLAPGVVVSDLVTSVHADHQRVLLPSPPCW